MAEDGRFADPPRQQEQNMRRNKEGGGPRSLLLKRSENNGFGFTLRHFIVYPPESYTMVGGNARGDGPMDTIFVKWVRPGSPAALAGLSTGDRLVSVNGESTAGRPYAQVVRLIQQSPPTLHLLVVPKEADLLQLYFGETAHNPETNQRPARLEMSSRSSSVQRGMPSPHRRPTLPQESNVSGDALFSLPPNLAGCRLSLDGGSSRRGSQDTHSSDDSLLMNRIRKSLEQKEEFLRSPGVGVGVRGEYYLRPGKLQAPLWPPVIPASSVQPPPPSIHHHNHNHTHSGGFVYGGPVNNMPGVEDRGRTGRRSRDGPLEAPLYRDPSRDPHRDPLSPHRDPMSPPPSASHHQLRLVSERARQFESGLVLPDRTDLYRSELARLGTKRNVPNVAVRRKEFESRADWRKHRESRSLDSNTTTKSGSVTPPPPTSGNRIIPIGSSKLHCDPPNDYRHLSSPDRKMGADRPRSNSAEGAWPVKELPLRHKAVRQDSYLAAVNKPLNEGGGGGSPEIRVVPPTPRKKASHGPKRPDTLHLVQTHRPATPATDRERESPVTPDSSSRPPDNSPALDSVVRRNKLTSEEQGSEDERSTRRVSYLKATRPNVDSDLELSDNEPPLPSPHKKSVRKWRPPLFPDDIQRLVKIFEPSYEGRSDGSEVPLKDQEISIEGVLFCKVTQVDGKKAHDRSWRQVWGVVRGDTLYLFKDRKDAIAETPVDHERIDLSGCSALAAQDYTKRRHVIRLSTPNVSEVLLQAESGHDMSRWLSSLSSPPSQETISPVGGVGSGQNISPVAAHKGIMKLTTTFRNRSPTGQSPVNKTRKPSQPEVTVGSPKSKTWKGMVAKQLRRIQTGSPVSPTAPVASYPEGATIGVPLELCPPSKNNEFVPLLVELCTGIVEERGLEIIGIYRVPGNTGAVSSLTEAVNRGLESALLDQEQRWTDVNVISSLLKLFFRNLPDCLLTTELYPMFIAADKILDPRLRVLSIRKLVQELPDHHLHTLKHLMKHLKLVVEHSSVNKMEARNLAIVFGPTLVRAGDDNMVTMVTDMSHQCRVVETLIQHADWCFSEEGPESLRLEENHDSCGLESSNQESTNQSLLLGNVHKLGGSKCGGAGGEVSRRDIVSSIIGAANRKMMKGKARKSLPTPTPTPTSPTNQKGDKRKDSGGGLVGGSRRKESDPGAEGGGARSVAGAIACGVRGSALFSGAALVSSASLKSPDKDEVDKGAEEVEGAEERKEVGRGGTIGVEPTTKEGTIVTYTGLSETTQERIRRFELETKAMLQRDKNKEWVRNSPQLTPPSAIRDKIAVSEGGGGGKRKPAAGPPGDERRTGVVRAGSLDSLADLHETNNNNEVVSSETDLVSSLTDTFDAKMKSLGLLAAPGSGGPKRDGTSPSLKLSPLSFRDPSLHRSFTSPNLEMKLLEASIGGLKDNSDKKKEEEVEDEEKEKVEKDDEKENWGGRLKRSESFRTGDEKKESTVKLLRRTESLNKKEGKGPGLKRSDSLTKTEKTDLNLRKRQVLEAGSKSKMKRKTGGGSDRGIKRRHTVGGTKDFDKTTWLDNREREAAEERRTSSPDLVSAGQQPQVVVWGAPRL